MSMINDEILILAQYVKNSKYRTKALGGLYHNPLTPTKLSKVTGIHISHISTPLKELMGKGCVRLVNPEAYKGRLYVITNTGETVYNLLMEGVL